MTILAPLTLDGVGTPLVESVASYYLRLTYVHQVSPGQLSQVICNDSAYLRMGEPGPQLKWRAMYPAMLCSHSSQTKVLVQRLEMLTGQNNLARGTLLGLRENLCRNQTCAISEHRRWCPKCYSNQQVNTAEPLAWAMPLVTRCPMHDIPLEEACTHCGANQPAWRTGHERRLCNKCNRPLTETRCMDAEPTVWQLWCQREMLRILEHSASPAFAEFCPDAVKLFLFSLPPARSGIRGPTAQGKRIRGLRKAISKSPDLRPRLATIFQIAASWGTSPLDILLRPEEAASPNLFNGDPIIPRSPPKRKFRKQNYSQCDKRMRALIALPEQILLPPAIHICNEFRVSASNFIESRRETWNGYIRERNRRLKEHKLKEVRLANTYMDQLVARMRHSGQRLYRRSVITQMMSDIHVPKSVARSALRLALVRMRMRRTDLSNSS